MQAAARRVCRELGTKKNILVINDEAHHAWRVPPKVKIAGLSKDELKGDACKKIENKGYVCRSCGMGSRGLLRVDFLKLESVHHDLVRIRSR